LLETPEGHFRVDRWGVIQLVLIRDLPQWPQIVNSLYLNRSGMKSGGSGYGWVFSDPGDGSPDGTGPGSGGEIGDGRIQSIEPPQPRRVKKNSHRVKIKYRAIQTEPLPSDTDYVEALVGDAGVYFYSSPNGIMRVTKIPSVSHTDMNVFEPLN
jgi:hypothetical protein